jgi:HEAT repeat protein
MSFFKRFGLPNIQKMQAKGDVEGLIEALGYDKGDRRKSVPVRKNAAQALGELGDERAVEPLIDALTQETDIGVSDTISVALGKIGSPAVEPLITILRTGEALDRFRAAEVLHAIGDERAIEPFITALKDDDGDVRKVAAWGLAKTGTPVVEPLVALLKDDYKWARVAAAKALDELGWQPTQDGESVDYWIAKGNWDAVVGIGIPAVRPLVAILESKDREMRRAAAEALGRLGDKRAVEPLIAVLNDPGEKEDVRETVIEALKNMGVSVQVKERRSRRKSETTLFAFFARASGGPGVVSTSDQGAWVKRLRDAFELPKARVVMFAENEWDAPPLDSIDDAAIQRNLVSIRSAIKKVLTGQGVPAAALDGIVSDIVKLSHPLTRLVILVVKYTSTQTAKSTKRYVVVT